MPDDKRFALMSKEVAETIATSLPFRIGSPEDIPSQVTVIKRNAYLPDAVLEAQVAGIQMGRELLSDIIRRTGEAHAKIPVRVADADGLLAETWRFGPKAVFASASGEIVLRAGWYKASIEILRRIVFGVVNTAAPGELIGYVFDPSTTLIAFGESSLKSCTAANGVVVLTDVDYNTASALPPAMFAVRIAVEALSEGCLKIIKAG